MSLDGDKMAALRQRYVASTSDQAVQIEALLAAGDLEGVRRLAHSLAGRSGMFGFAGIGDLARLVDEAEPDALPGHARELLAGLRGLAQAEG